MTEEDLVKDARKMDRWQQHKFMVLVGGAIMVSLFLVMVALQLYNSSGAAQLDLSRPGYQSVRKQATYSDDLSTFPSTGPMDKATVDSFRTLYDKQMKAVTTIDSFGGDVMSDQALSIDDVAAPAPDTAAQ